MDIKLIVLGSNTMRATGIYDFGSGLSAVSGRREMDGLIGSRRFQEAIRAEG